MGRSKEVKTWELEDDVNEGAPKTMYMGFIRVTVENILKNPKVIEKLGTTTFTYDEKYIQSFLDNYSEDSIEYAYILHKEDTNENGEKIDGFKVESFRSDYDPEEKPTEYLYAEVFDLYNDGKIYIKWTVDHEKFYTMKCPTNTLYKGAKLLFKNITV